MILIYSIFPTKKSTEKTIKMILKNRLAVCINYWPINSQYLWRGGLEKTKEWSLIIKTIKKNYLKIQKIIKRNNPYKTPAILSWPVTKVEKNYLKWLKKEMR